MKAAFTALAARAHTCREEGRARLDVPVAETMLAALVYLNLPLLAMLAVAAAAFLAGGVLSVGLAAAGLALGLGAGWAALHFGARIAPRRHLAGAAAAALLCLLAGLGTFWIYDTGWDSQAYHLPAILALADGWSPLSGADEAVSPWAGWYPKAAWVLAAQLYLLLGELELFRITAPILAVEAGLVFVLVLRASGVAGRVPALALALLGAANPVVLAQALTHYVDGMLAALLLALVAGTLSARALALVAAGRGARHVAGAARQSQVLGGDLRRRGGGRARPSCAPLGSARFWRRRARSRARSSSASWSSATRPT